ncbi:carbohydrate ABC transporter permease [Paenibacillus sedimenti]|uniref:Sugar ABC transporter permease n=1 Tax=Paenibacillus sedimenti TaxID=2770274 RepID=A0A926QNF8_9BACL|nr:sugar ABC transporter permease [Paenibacillus sedimenti]MBD0384339.1 sugar ABC transporter permease [Paenibacillus sedimenti]
MNWAKRQRLSGYLFILPNMIGVTLFFIIPALLSLFMMFTDYKFTSPSIHFIGLKNFTRVFRDPVFYIAIKNTLLFMASVPVSMALAFIVALVLNRSVYMKKALRTMYFMPYITSGVAIAFVWMLLFQPTNGPINHMLRAVGIANPPGWLSTTQWSMYAIDIIWIWFLLGYNMIIYLAALQEVPQELTEAAKIDGASMWRTVWNIIWPLVSPSTFLLLITGLIASVKTFGLIEAVTQGGPGNSTTILSLFVYHNAFRYYEMGYASAISWILFLIIFIITIIQWVGQKRWVHY